MAEKYQKEKQDLVNTTIDLTNKYKQLEIDFNIEKQVKFEENEKGFDLEL